MIKKIFANLLDEMILFGVAAILLFLTDLILGAAGFNILQPAVFLTAYLFIANVFYFPIMENSKYSTTLGKRILKIDEVVEEAEVVKTEEVEIIKIEEIKAEKVEEAKDVK
ncbi:MAG TPA: RDD family protein [Clostridium sp.]